MAQGRVRNRITVVPFGAASFVELIRAASRAAPTSRTVVAQVEYLARYCKALGARTVVIEDHYIDRHYLDEFAFYYCRSLSPPENHVRRFHLFEQSFDEGALRRRIRDIAKGHTVPSPIERAYRGFVSIRPIPAVPIGRTVLSRLDDGEPRDIWATGKQTVHLANLELQVDGLAFQQQDLAVGACATAALWSALSRVTRMEHMRAPTPAEVSEAAGRHLLASGRVVPAAAGLTIQQLSEAVRGCGFAPEYVRAERNEIFIATLHAYLLSGIPPVLILRGPLDGHAVTAVGFRAEGAAHPLLQHTVQLRSARLTKLYIHDDRIGPYARCFPIPTAASDDWKESLVLKVEADCSKPTSTVETWVVVAALVPVYPKIRLSVRNLLTLAEAMAEVMESTVGGDRTQRLSVELFYRRSGEYLRGLGGEVDPTRAGDGLIELALPRWCGVVRWYFDETPIVEFVYDTTDVLRDSSDLGGELLRGIVCRYPPFAPVVDQLARRLGVPKI